MKIEIRQGDIIDEEGQRQAPRQAPKSFVTRRSTVCVEQKN